MRLESLPDKNVCYRGARIQCPKCLQLIMQGHNFTGMCCAIEAVPYEMKIAIQLLCRWWPE